MSQAQQAVPNAYTVQKNRPLADFRLIDRSTLEFVVVVACLGINISLGWPSVIACILGLGGIQLFILGILGIYLGKLFLEHKSRPTYVVAEKTW